MNNKKDTSFIEIVKSSIRDRGIKKDQLLILLLLGILLLVIAIPTNEKDGSFDSSLPDGQDQAEGQNSHEDAQSAGDTKAAAQRESVSYEELYAQKLESFLSQVEGVGQVRVLIKVRASREQVVEKDTPVRENEEAGTDETGSTTTARETEQEETTVYEETQDGRQIPYVVKEYEPEIEGVIVAAQGADQPAVVQNILEAVQALLKVEVHKVKVLKMK